MIDPDDLPDHDLPDDEEPDATGPDPRRVRAEAEHAGLRLDRFLADAFPALSRSRIKTLVENGRLFRDGTMETQVAAKVRAGALYDLRVPAPEPGDPETEPQPEDLPLTILFEDAHLMVVDKPAGLSVHPAPGNWTGTLVNAVLHHAGESLRAVGAIGRPGIVHRLDKETSGVMVVAKSDFAMSSLGRQFQDRTIERRYRAFAVGAPRPPWGRTGRIETRLARDPKDRKRMAVVAPHVVAAGSEIGKRAATNYETLATFGRVPPPGAGPRAIELVCRLETGRTHQIRVHMAHVGAPLIGDPVYGDTRPAKALAADLPEDARLSRQALHAEHLAFTHPETGERLAFSTPTPPDMKRLRVALEAMRP